jgi:predicted Rossmann fold flavoprotein
MNIAIVGGGAAGLMAAATAQVANPDAKIFLIERNDGLGKKVMISGGGRCNVTTGIFDIKTMLTRYPRGGKFLSSAMHLFPPEQVYAWFESRGVPLKIEEDLRVFPQSNDGKDIVGVFEKEYRASHVRVLLKAYADRIEKIGEMFHVFLRSQDEPLVVDRVILTTGGQAYRHTGSTGDGYAFALALGHSLTPLAASLNSFTTSEKWTAQISGLSFQKATIVAKRGKKFSYTGPFLFTHKGISGPAVFAVSSLVAFESYDPQNPLDIFIDLFPDQSVDELSELIKTRIAENPKKSFVNDLIGMIPKSLTEVLCEELEIPLEKKAGEMGKKDLLRIVNWLKGIPLHAVGRGAGDEFVTAGGVDLKDVNPSTMESKKCPGLFFAGEILDIDGFTGGFNLQASWATGHLAGEHAAQP